MKKISILYPFIGGPTVGGSHISALKMIAELDREKYDPKIVLHHTDGELGTYIHSLGLDYEVLPDIEIMAPKYSRTERNVSVLGYAFKTYGAIKAVLRRLDPDIVHTNDGRMHSNWVIPTKMSGRKFIWHNREGPSGTGVNKLAPLFADRILSVSYFSKPQKPIKSVDKIFSVIRSPFEFTKTVPDKAAAHSMIAKELNLPENSIFVGYFGGLNDRKRPLNFVRAVKEIQAEIPGRPVHGLLFGKVILPQSKLDERAMALAADLGIAEQVHLMGYRSPIEEYMAGVDALLITAVNEPFGRTLIEAMYLRTPVIATRHGGNPEAITDGETGFLVKPESPEAFAKPMADLMRDPTLLNRITEAAHNDAANNYGLKRTVDAVSKVYDELAGVSAPQGVSA
ncbi:glycosyltransferase family 4 protein [Actibacterium lipolyticum]|uniref:D-inositol 3-phosphate glycosyltransferase n=1 Tax=Actibacterium lipolyticum TaxID=1524263 RepID=A0A238KYL5_9RHOB|nr:glycosyltransferase family 4 protein [Actibacterium lipolyticum]SMX47292.1 D-inositol 3-phosphate glycosyltransferase [Actibacterium lipolyticum]